MNYRKRLLLLCSILTLTATGIAACSSSDSDDKKDGPDKKGEFTESNGLSGVTTARLDASEMFTGRDKEVGYEESDSVRIDLSDDKITCVDSSVTIKDQTATITKAGSYVLSGSLKNGQIYVDADSEKIQLVLDNVSISNDASAAIFVAKADKVFITLTDGSTNTLSNAGSFTAIGKTNVDGVIFSKDDIVFNGDGALTIESAAHGIVSKNDLKFTGGTYTVNAKSHALCGKNSVRIADGAFTLTAGKDAVHSEHAKDTEKGYIYIAGGSFTCTTTGDGFDSSSILQIDDGNFTLTSSKAKGCKADTAIFVDGGTFTLNTADDGFHSNKDLEVTDGTCTIASGDDAFHAAADLVINGGTIDITKSREGIEGQTITVNDGSIDLVSSDDGFNASGGNDQSGLQKDADTNNTDANAAGKDDKRGFGGKGADDPFVTDENAFLTINGGKITVDAGGDGLDSNGVLAVNGGETYVSGPTNGGNGALDSGKDAYITGGILIAAGASQMAENFSSNSSQCAMLVTFDKTTTGKITLTDSDGKELVSYEDNKTFDSVVISTPDIKTQNTYTVTAGDCLVTVEMTETIYGESNGFGGGKGGMGGKDGMNGGKGDHPHRGHDDSNDPEHSDGQRPELPDDFDPQQIPDLPDDFDPQQMPDFPQDSSSADGSV